MTQHAKYSIFPGRQHYVVVVPSTFQHLFFEGVQSMDATPNSEELNHGQYGFASDVITDRDFKNVTGTVSCKDFGYMQRVLRSMSGQDPDTSFMFDMARLTAVDIFENIYNKLRNRVESAKWWVDFTSSAKYSSTIDDVETWDFDYTAKRLITIDGYQIVCQTFADTTLGQSEFILMAPAIIDPVMEDVKMNTTTGVVNGTVRHELCPIQYALRVWVDGAILTEADQASITTVSNTGVLTSTLHLKTPLAKAGQIVKVMWLADGASLISSTAVTKAPIMLRALPDLDKSTTPAVWELTMTVVFNKTIDPAALTALAASNFSLTWTTGGNAYSWVPSTIDNTASVTGNAVKLTFTGVPMESVGGATPVAAAAGTTWPAATPAILSYSGVVLKDLEGYVSPYHVLNIAGY